MDYEVDLSKRFKLTFYLISKNNDYNSKIIKLLKIFKIAFKKYNTLNKALNTVTKYNCLIEFAKCLLKNNIDINEHSK